MERRKHRFCFAFAVVAGVMSGIANDPVWTWNDTERPPDMIECKTSTTPFSVTVGGVVSCVDAEEIVTVGAVETAETGIFTVNCRPLGLTIYFK